MHCTRHDDAFAHMMSALHPWLPSHVMTHGMPGGHTIVLRVSPTMLHSLLAQPPLHSVGHTNGTSLVGPSPIIASPASSPVLESPEPAASCPRSS